MEDFGFYLLLCLVLHPIIKLYKKYDCIKFKKNVALFTRDVLDSLIFSRLKLDTGKISKQVNHWLDTHNLNYYNRKGKYYVEDCAETILREIFVNEVDDDGDLVSSRIDEAVSWAMYYRSIGRTKKNKTTWYKTIWNSIKCMTFEEVIIAIHYIFLIIAWGIAVNVYYTKSYSNVIYKEYNKEADNFYKDVSSIRHSAMEMDTIFTFVLDSTSNYYMEEYFIECARDLNDIIIDKTNSYNAYIEFMKDLTNKNSQSPPQKTIP